VPISKSCAYFQEQCKKNKRASKKSAYFVVVCLFFSFDVKRRLVAFLFKKFSFAKQLIN